MHSKETSRQKYGTSGTRLDTGNIICLVFLIHKIEMGMAKLFIDFYTNECYKIRNYNTLKTGLNYGRYCQIWGFNGLQASQTI